MDKKTDFNQYLGKKKKDFNVDDENFNLDVSRFIVSNNWFGCTPIIEGKTILFDEESLKKLGSKIDEYCKNYNKNTNEKIEVLNKKLNTQLPKTAKLIKKYIKSVKLDEESSLCLIDFICSYLPGELDESSDNEISAL